MAVEETVIAFYGGSGGPTPGNLCIFGRDFIAILKVIKLKKVKNSILELPILYLELPILYLELPFLYFRTAHFIFRTAHFGKWDALG